MKRRIAILGSVLFLVMSCSISIYAASDMSYVVDQNGRREIPLAYAVTSRLISFDSNPAYLEEPEDICVDSEDSLYILDSGNSRVIKVSDEGEFLKVIKPKGEYQLSNPEGIYVDDSGRIYIADTGNHRILIVNQEGKVTDVITQPDNPLFDADYPFRPVKVGVNSLGQIYAINKQDYHGFCLLNEDNEFLGYFATNRVEKNILIEWISRFASSSQREQMGKTTPPQHTNFCIADDGSIYVTTANTDVAQIKRLSATGTNFYPYTGSFGEVTEAEDGEEKKPAFTDITADSNGILTALDGTTGKLYQYDESGVMLSVSGGIGSWKGRVMRGVALAQDSQSRIFVLDKSTGSIQCFVPTGFTNKVHEALAFHNNGDYESAEEIWSEILANAHDYAPAYVGLAKVAAKKKDFASSMRYFRLSGDRGGYSDSFLKYQKQKIQEHFPAVLLITLILSAALIYMIRELKRRADYANQPDVMLHDGRSIALITMFAPWDAFRLIKYDRNRFYPVTPAVILCIALVSNVLRAYLYSYQTIGVDPQEVSLITNVLSFIIPFVLWCFGYYYVSGIFDGEVLLREVFAASCYALLPFAVFAVPVSLLSSIMGISGISTISKLMGFIWCWVIALVFLGVRSMNRIKSGRTVVIMAAGVFAALFIALVLTFLYLLGIQLTGFIGEVINECRYML